ncbi:MAG: DUF1772 domain-containing protein [Lysobacter sp.]
MVVDTLLNAGLFAAILASGLMAGFFYAFSICVMRALAQRPAAEAMAAMQAINRVVLNPWFLPLFVGTALLVVALAVIALIQGVDASSICIAIGAAAYALGTFAVTMNFNVPLNNALAAAASQDPASDRLWADYLTVWTRWNHVRSLSALLSLACFAAAAMSRSG